jgi:hypothetical protein
MQHLSQWVGEPVAYREARQPKVGRAPHVAGRGSPPAEPQARTFKLRTACLLLHLQDEVAWGCSKTECQGKRIINTDSLHSGVLLGCCNHSPMDGTYLPA